MCASNARMAIRNVKKEKKMTNEKLKEFFETTEALVQKHFRFSIIHNPQEHCLRIVSATNPDMIKHAFPDFNIYLSGRTEKIVERVFYYV